MRTQTLNNQRVRVFGHEITVCVTFRFRVIPATATDPAVIEVEDFYYGVDEALTDLLLAWISAEPDRRGMGIAENTRAKIEAAITERVADLSENLSLIDSDEDDDYDDYDDGN